MPGLSPQPAPPTRHKHKHTHHRDTHAHCGTPTHLCVVEQQVLAEHEHAAARHGQQPARVAGQVWHVPDGRLALLGDVDGQS
jgi:hypothetical protein